VRSPRLPPVAPLRSYGGAATEEEPAVGAQRVPLYLRRRHTMVTASKVVHTSRASVATLPGSTFHPPASPTCRRGRSDAELVLLSSPPS